MGYPEKGTYVARRSYGCDQIFEVIGLDGNNVLLKGLLHDRWLTRHWRFG